MVTHWKVGIGWIDGKQELEAASSLPIFVFFKNENILPFQII